MKDEVIYWEGGYTPIHLERGRKLFHNIIPLFLLLDINLYTSGGDGNPSSSLVFSSSYYDINLLPHEGTEIVKCDLLVRFDFEDINLFISREDGNDFKRV